MKFITPIRALKITFHKWILFLLMISMYRRAILRRSPFHGNVPSSFHHNPALYSYSADQPSSWSTLSVYSHQTTSSHFRVQHLLVQSSNQQCPLEALQRGKRFRWQIQPSTAGPRHRGRMLWRRSSFFRLWRVCSTTLEKRSITVGTGTELQEKISLLCFFFTYII